MLNQALRGVAVPGGNRSGTQAGMGVDGGTQVVNGGVYREVIPNEKRAFAWAWHTTPERESFVILTFRRDGNGTMLTLHHEQFVDEAARDGHERGWSGALAKLERLFA